MGRRSICFEAQFDLSALHFGRLRLQMRSICQDPFSGRSCGGFGGDAYFPKLALNSVRKLLLLLALTTPDGRGRLGLADEELEELE
jgi:hypothetical protein